MHKICISEKDVAYLIHTEAYKHGRFVQNKQNDFNSASHFSQDKSVPVLTSYGTINLKLCRTTGRNYTDQCLGYGMARSGHHHGILAKLRIHSRTTFLCRKSRPALAVQSILHKTWVLRGNLVAAQISYAIWPCDNHNEKFQWKEWPDMTIHTAVLVIKPTRCTNFSDLFWNETLHVSDNSYIHHQEFFTVHTAMVCHTGS